MAGVLRPILRPVRPLRPLTRAITEAGVGGADPWVNPDSYVGVTYDNDYGVKFYDDGGAVHVMMADADSRAEWRDGLIVSTIDPADGLSYSSVDMGRVKDPTMQGVTPTMRYVNNITGNNANDGLTSGTAWKTVNYAITTINALGAGVYQLNVSTSTFLGGNAAGWDATSTTIAAGVKLKIIGVGATKPWWLPGMRNSYTKATFAWTSMGNGIWRCTTGSISAAAKATPCIFDLSVLDSDGAPTPCAYAAGPFADEAAILAGLAAAGPSWHTTAANEFYVKLSSGAEPDPGVNFGYVELIGTAIFQIGEGGALMIENFRGVNNAKTATAGRLFYCRPLTFTQGPAAPNVVHDVYATIYGCEAYGMTENPFAHHSVTRFVVKDCKAAYCWFDGVNSHSLYTYPDNSSSTDEGMHQHTFVQGGLFKNLGPNGFRTQPAPNVSCNAITDHDRGRTTAVNASGSITNGASYAFVGGSKGWAFRCTMDSPNAVTPATDVYQACYLSSGQAAGTADPTEVFNYKCGGTVADTGAVLYSGGIATVVAVGQTPPISVFIAGSGTIRDGDGNNL